MQKLIKCALTASLVFVMAVSMSACGGEKTQSGASSDEAKTAEYSYTAAAYVNETFDNNSVSFSTVSVKKAEGVLENTDDHRETFSVEIGGKTCEFEYRCTMQKYDTGLVFEMFTGRTGIIHVQKGTDTVLYYICMDTELFDKVKETAIGADEAKACAKDVIAGFENIDLSSYEISAAEDADTSAAYRVTYDAKSDGRTIYTPFNLTFDEYGRLFSYKRSEYIGKADASKFPAYSVSKADAAAKQKLAAICSENGLTADETKETVGAPGYLSDSYTPCIYYYFNTTCTVNGSEVLVPIVITVAIEEL